MRRACVLFALVLAGTPLAGFVSSRNPDCCAGGGDMACCLIGAEGGPAGCSLRRCSDGDSTFTTSGSAFRSVLPAAAGSIAPLAPARSVRAEAASARVIEPDAPPVPPPRA